MDVSPQSPRRLPDATTLGGIVLEVADLERAVGYYQDVLGLAVSASSGHRARLGATPAAPPLVELRERAGARPVPREGRLGLFHFAIRVPSRDDLGRFITHLVRTGIPFASADHAVSEALYLWDPDGLGIEVYADRPRREWQRRGDELYMTTDALDVQSLIDETRGSQWQGMPAAAVMGHLHLNVDRLDDARRFYADALGFDIVVKSYPGALFMSAGGYHHHLGTNTWARGAARAADGDARLVEWSIVVPDTATAEAALTRLSETGASRAEGSGVIDPWGVVLRLTTAGTMR